MALSEVPEDLEEINTPLNRLTEGEKHPNFIRSRTHYEKPAGKFGPKQSVVNAAAIVEQSSVSNFSLESVRKPKLIINETSSVGNLSFRHNNNSVF